MKVKKQHFVPRFYLKSFSKNDHQIEVFDKSTKKTFSSNVNDIAFEKFFYDYDLLDNQTGKQTIENQLSQFETGHAVQFQIFIQNLNSGFSGLDQKKLKASLSEFIGVQLKRTPRSFENMDWLFKNLDSGFKSKGWNIADWDEELKKFHHLKQLNFSLQDLDKVIVLLSNKIWVVWENNSTIPFITSDFPTVGYFEPTRNEFEIYFPVSPKFSLSLFDKLKYKDLKKLDGKTVSLNYDNVFYYNDLIWRNSFRHCFSVDNNFDYLINTK